MSSLFARDLLESDRRAHDHARAAKAKEGAAACAVATGLLGSKLIDGGGAATDWAVVSCPFLGRDCGVALGKAGDLKASKTGAGWTCACGRSGDTIQLVREVCGLSFGQAVDRLTKFVEAPRNEATGDMFGGLL